MSAHSANNRIPLPLLLVNGVGALMMAAGMMGLVAPDAVPALARPAVAYALLGAGLMLDAAAVMSILRITAKARRGTTSA
jgi:fluoride ion exporter CrcB/FEX